LCALGGAEEADMPDAIDRRGLLVSGLVVSGLVSGETFMIGITQDDESSVQTGELLNACLSALEDTLSVYETTDLSETIARLRPLEITTRQVPRTRRLRGSAALDWMRLHALVAASLASAYYDRGQHAEAVNWADRAARFARAAGDPALSARAQAVRARVVRQHSPAVASQIAATAGRMAGLSPARAMLSGKVAAGAYAAAGDAEGVRESIRRAWITMDGLGPRAHGRPGFSLKTYSPADLALACAEALTTVDAPDQAAPYLELADELISGSGLTGMVISVRMAQARVRLAGRRPDRDGAAHHVNEAVALAEGRPAEWLHRLVRDISDLAGQRTGRDFDDLVAATGAWR
jgi:hypothetical protein